MVLSNSHFCHFLACQSNYRDFVEFPAKNGHCCIWPLRQLCDRIVSAANKCELCTAVEFRWCGGQMNLTIPIWSFPVFFAKQSIVWCWLNSLLCASPGLFSSFDLWWPLSYFERQKLLHLNTEMVRNRGFSLVYFGDGYAEVLLYFERPLRFLKTPEKTLHVTTMFAAISDGSIHSQSKSSMIVSLSGTMQPSTARASTITQKISQKRSLVLKQSYPNSSMTFIDVKLLNRFCDWSARNTGHRKNAGRPTKSPSTVSMPWLKFVKKFLVCNTSLFQSVRISEKSQIIGVIARVEKVKLSA